MGGKAENQDCDILDGFADLREPTTNAAGLTGLAIEDHDLDPWVKDVQFIEFITNDDPISWVSVSLLVSKRWRQAPETYNYSAPGGLFSPQTEKILASGFDANLSAYSFNMHQLRTLIPYAVFRQGQGKAAISTFSQLDQDLKRLNEDASREIIAWYLEQAFSAEQLADSQLDFRNGLVVNLNHQLKALGKRAKIDFEALNQKISQAQLGPNNARRHLPFYSFDQRLGESMLIAEALVEKISRKSTVSIEDVQRRFQPQVQAQVEKLIKETIHEVCRYRYRWRQAEKNELATSSELI